MKKFIFLIIFFCSASLMAQSLNRTLISGQINVPAQEDPDGIVVYNITARQGTITNSEGMFFLNVKLNDRVLVQSIQFAPVTITVDRGIISSNKMNITLRESVNVLEEIVVSPTDLTGNISVDVNRVPIEEFRPDTTVVPYVAGMYANAGPHDNVALDNETWSHGLNFVNLFKLLAGKRDNGKFKPTAEDELAQMYSNAFFKKNLNIKEENIGRFMDYVAANGLNDQMLKQGNELNLIQFLLDKRNDFKKEMGE